MQATLETRRAAVVRLCIDLAEGRERLENAEYMCGKVLKVTREQLGSRLCPEGKRSSILARLQSQIEEVKANKERVELVTVPTLNIYVLSYENYDKFLQLNLEAALDEVRQILAASVATLSQIKKERESILQEYYAIASTAGLGGAFTGQLVEVYEKSVCIYDSAVELSMNIALPQHTTFRRCVLVASKLFSLLRVADNLALWCCDWAADQCWKVEGKFNIFSSAMVALNRRHIYMLCGKDLANQDSARCIRYGVENHRWIDIAKPWRLNGSSINGLSFNEHILIAYSLRPPCEVESYDAFDEEAGWTILPVLRLTKELPFAVQSSNIQFGGLFETHYTVYLCFDYYKQAEGTHKPIKRHRTYYEYIEYAGLKAGYVYAFSRNEKIHKLSMVSLSWVGK